MSQSSSSDAVSHIIDQSVAHMLTPLELRMLCNTAIIIRHEVFELVADGDLFLPLTRKVSSSSGEECGKGTGEVALSGIAVGMWPDPWASYGRSGGWLFRLAP